MKITPKDITVGELAEGYEDKGFDGVRGYGKRLDIRPAYQREFVYDDAKRAAVIDTVNKGYPLNVMYWAVRGDGTYEIIDGQQRTISLCQYVSNQFSVPINGDLLKFHNAPDAVKERILSYRLTVYFCEGTDEERLQWFRTINIAGERLYDQELRNAVYAGPWVSDAKRYFSRPGQGAALIGAKYLTGSCIRQEFLQTAIKWISGGSIEKYMCEHQSDKNALALWQYFKSVITWVEATFRHTPDRQRLMKGLPWGRWYDKLKDRVLDAEALESDIARLLADDEVEKKSGIYEYVLFGRAAALNLRAFSEAQRQTAYARQKGVCPHCHKHFELTEMEADHITPWHEGGRTVDNNCQMLCRECNRRKGGK